MHRSNQFAEYYHYYTDDDDLYKYLLSRTIVDKDGCMIWQGSKTLGGYAQAKRDGASIRVHRFIACHLAGVTMTPQVVVMHTCDERSCINPEHLKIGSQSENMKEAYAKGRIRYHGLSGSRNPMATISNKQAEEIKVKYKQGIKQRIIAAEYGISQGHVSAIVNGKRR